MDEYAPFRISNDALDDSDELRRRMRDEGYLFFKGKGPKQKLLAARRDITARLAVAGWIDPADPMSARWSGVGPYTEGEPEYAAVYRDVIHLPSFLAVPEDEVFTTLLGRIVDGPAVCHRLRIGRITFPKNTGQTTPPHQDFHYIRGTSETYTVWQPLGDCPIELGPLAVLPRSHHAGFIQHSEDKSRKFASMGLSDEQIPTGGWCAADFELGDFLVFHSFTIHKALPNRTPDRIRLSTDNRYTREGAELSEWSKLTHYNL